MEMCNGIRLEERLDGGGEFAFYRASRTPTPQQAVGEPVVVLHASLDAAERCWPPWADPSVATLLEHPAIVRMLDEGIAGSYRYFVFEHMDGGDLRRPLRFGPMSFAASVVVTRAVIEALVTAHGAVGRDGKPFCFAHGNLSPRWVFLSRSGTVKLGGFGFSRLKPERQRSGAHLVALSPESFSGAENDTVPGDMYYLGALLFLLLFGKSYVSPVRAVRLAKVGHLSMATAIPDSPVRPLLTRLLAEKPEHRFASMVEVRAALDACPQNEAEGRATLVDLLRRC